MFVPCLPTIPGDEGVGEVVETGHLVRKVKPGDKVVLSTRNLGTWCYYGIYHETSLHIVPPNLALAEASMLTIAPCTAYKMLKDFRDLCPGQSVVQNAANSPCGQCVIQICKALGINTYNIVASHCSYDTVKEHLLSIGATSVHTLEEAEQMCSFTTSFKRPVLGLNCLGGRYEDVILKLLDYNSSVVYYGCAYDLPLSKIYLRPDVKFSQFHLGVWDAQASEVEKDMLLKKLIQLIVTGCFKAPLYRQVELKNYVHALRNTVDCEAFSTQSYIFDFSLP